MKLEPRISLVTLGVSNMETSRNFYEGLGWTLSDKSTAEVSFFQGRGIVLGLFGQNDLAMDAGIDNDQSGFRGAALAYNCRSEAEVDEAFIHAVSIGAKALKAPEKVFWGGYSGYFADPDGHLWELAFNPFFAMDEDGHIDLDGRQA